MKQVDADAKFLATSFDAIVANKLRDPEFARHYAAECARIAVIDDGALQRAM